MKKFMVIFLSILFCFTVNVKALTSTEIKSRNVCGNLPIELATANSDKTLTHVDCYSDYKTAKAKMNATNNDNLVILERKSGVTKIIDAKMALVYLGVKSVNTNTTYYTSSSLSSSLTYANHHSTYGATDGVFLELNYSNYAIKVKSNGITGWLKNGDYIIVPLMFTGNYSFYQVTSTGLYHYYSKDIETTYTQTSRVLDKKPAQLTEGRYYSHDGIYFYKYASDMIKDYVNNTYQNAVNYNNPYYNYYMYLPHRARSNYSSDDIDAYLKNTKGFIGTIYGKKLVNKYSNMYQTGTYFKSSESLYGAYAIMMMSLATNESASGQSAIAISKNNLFGHSAYDSSPFASASGYLSPYYSILAHANNYINCGYANPNDYRYYGSHFGSKLSGMNVKYASDPFWGEKATNYYYQFDSQNGFLDYNYYQLGIINKANVSARTEPNQTSSIPYQFKTSEIPVIILEEVKNGDTLWYKIVSDANLNSSRTSILGCSNSNYYNWNSYVYVLASDITKINQTQNGKYNSNNDANVIKPTFTYQEYASASLYTPKSGLINKDTTVYDTATLNVSSNKVAKQGHLATVFMAALDENKKVVAYLITTDYSKNQRGWVKADDLTLNDKDILRVNLTKEGDTLPVYKTPGGSETGKIYTDTYSVIVDKMTYQSDLWLKIFYGLDNTYAWINTNISSSKGSLSYTTSKLNQAPVITASNRTIFVGDTFDPLKDVTAYDAEDGNITSKIKVIENNVNKDVVGAYLVTYQVTDSSNQTTTKSIQITVKNYALGKSLFIYEIIKEIKNDTFQFKGFLAVQGMNNTNLEHELIFENEKTLKTYTFKMEDYNDYPYEVTNTLDNKVYDYSDGWFKGDISLKNIPDGNYRIKVRTYNKTEGYYAEDYFTNIAYQEMPRRVQGERGYSFDIDYSYHGSPIVVAIRSDGLLSYEEPTSLDPMYNFFNELKLDGNKLTIDGTSHSVSVSYSKNDNVSRSLILENTETFKRYTFDLGYIDNGPYQVTLAVPDNKDKTRAWFKKTIDLSQVEKGNYAIYIKTTSNSKTYYGELIDIAYTDFKNINTTKYEFKRIDDQRLRLELTVK